MTIEKLSENPDRTVESFELDLASAGIRGFWDMLGEYEMLEPRNPEQPGLWSYRDYRPLGYESLTKISIEKADRRNLFFSNPGLPGSGAITSRLLGGVQVVNAGETSSVHRHTAAATRVLLEGAGGYTTVEGEKCVLQFGDVVINPNGLWHETGNDGDSPVMWMDVLDLPLTKTLNANFFYNDYSELGSDGVKRTMRNQSITNPDDWSARAYGAAGGVRPVRIDGIQGNPYGSAQMLYKYGPIRELLDTLSSQPNCPPDGPTVEYYDPLTGQPVLRTLDVRMQLLRPGRPTSRFRSTAGTIYCCLEGSGKTIVDDIELEWSAKDIFVAPGWSWQHHICETTDAVLYAVSDAPALRQLGLLIEERLGPDGVIARYHR